MIPPTISGTVERQLLSGLHEDKLVLLEIIDNELYAASDFLTREEIPIEEIGAEDVEKAINSLIKQIEYYGIRH